ncbi:MAG: aldo/keto reductase [Theionarchaea archaeon]|nr:aldo/keto reductase [Theionarchaea archaeon]
MKTVRLGKTGLKVSRIGIGGIPIQRPPLDEAIKVIQRALDLGVTFIDTALGYGTSEERIGKGIAGRREEVILATKGGRRDKATTLEHIEMSLKRLNTDYIDLWQFHNVSTFEAYEQVIGPVGGMEGAQEALKAGKIRHIGVSSHNIDVALKMVSSGLFETIQFPFNFVTCEPADELVPLARQCDVGFIAMKPFAGGNLSDASLAIKYLLQFDNVVPDPGVEKIREIEEIVGIVNGSWELTSQDRQKMEEIRTELGTRFCRQCMYCMPCPQGVEIWLLMYVRNLWRLWPPKEFFPWAKRVVESGKNCIQCGECEEKCPYNLPIREMIVENSEFYQRVAREHDANQKR